MDKQPLDAKTAFALEGERLNLTDISLGAEQNRITGAIRVALDRMTASGKLGGDMRDLGVFSALAGQTLGGSGRLDVKLDDPKGQQAATATVRGQNISVTGPQGPVLAVKRLNLDADVKDALGAMRFDAKLDGSGIAAGGADLATLTASASGTPAKAQFQAQTNGKAGSPAQPARVALAGGFNQEGTLQKLRLDKLDGTYGGQPFRLVNPATATIGPNRYEVRNLLLASRDGRIALDAGLVRNALEGTATLTRVPLSLASLAAPDLGVDGQLDGNATFAGTIADPRADLNLKVSNMASARGRGRRPYRHRHQHHRTLAERQAGTGRQRHDPQARRHRHEASGGSPAGASPGTPDRGPAAERPDQRRPSRQCRTCDLQRPARHHRRPGAGAARRQPQCSAARSPTRSLAETPLSPMAATRTRPPAR